jgi:AcrR family transcriptional regulator
VAKLRWGDEAPTDATAARTRLVDAAETCIDRKGLARTTVEDVAREAEVSRATIYRYFGNRDELILRVLLRDLERSTDRDLPEFYDGVTDAEGFARATVDTAAYLVSSIRHSPKLQLLLQRETAGFNAAIAGASEALFREWTDDISPFLAAAQQAGRLRHDVGPEVIAEWILRAILSLLMIEGPRVHSEDEERRLLETFLAPALLPSAAPVVSR